MGILLARHIKQETRIEPINPGDQTGLHTFLSEVGARRSDVFESGAISCQISKRAGFSISDFSALRNRAASTPSITR